MIRDVLEMGDGQHPHVAAMKKGILDYTKRSLEIGVLPSAGEFREKVMPASLPVIVDGVIIRDDGGEHDLYQPEDIPRYSKWLPDAVRYGLQDSIESAFQRWRIEAEQSTEDPAVSLSNLIEYLLVRTYNIALMNAFADTHVVIPRINDDKVCSQCKRMLEGKVYYVAPAMISEPTSQECMQYLWINKDRIIPPLGVPIYPTVPLHRGCRHFIALYRGGDPASYYVKD